jgi:hypothetical protein
MCLVFVGSKLAFNENVIEYISEAGKNGDCL